MGVLEKLKEYNSVHKVKSEPVKLKVIEQLKGVEMAEILVSKELSSRLGYSNVSFKVLDFFSFVYINDEMLFMGPKEIIFNLLGRLETLLKIKGSGEKEVDAINELGEYVKLDLEEVLSKEIDVLNSLLYYINEDFIQLEEDIPEDVLYKLLSIVERNVGY